MTLSLAKVANHGSKLLLVLLVAAACFAFFNYVQRAELFPVRKVRVFGIQHLSRSEVKTLVSPLVSHGFFNIDVEVIRDRFYQLPWVSEVSVRRHWPDGIEVVLKEKQAIATWNQQSLLTDNGSLFVPAKTDFINQLPSISGPAGKQLYLLAHFNAMNRLLRPLHANIRSLVLTPSDEWRVTLQNGIVMKIGNADTLTRLQHFVKVYPKIIGSKSKDVEYIDLRYPSGMAVRWKSLADNALVEV